MEIRLSSSDGVPVYRQIVNQVKYMVASGRLRPGQELPPIRALAERLVINHNTVVHAYAELEKAGVIVCRQGAGCKVVELGSRRPNPDSAPGLAAKVDSVLADAAHLNMDLNQLLQLVLERHAALRKNQASTKSNANPERKSS